MGTDAKAQIGRHRKNLSNRGQLTGALLGFATGMGINVSSEHAGFRGVAGVFAVSGVLTATSWLRQRQRAPLTLLATRVLLISALLTAVLSIVGPKSWELSAVLGAAALTVAAALIHASLSTALTLLAGTGAIAAGSFHMMESWLSFFGIMDNPSNAGYPNATFLMAPTTIGIAFVVYGAALMHSGHPLHGLSSLGRVAAPLIGGIANIVLGVYQVQPMPESAIVVDFPGHDPAYVNATFYVTGSGLILGGSGLVGIAVANLLRHQNLRSTSIIASGMGCIVFGLPFVRIEPFPTVSSFSVTGAFILGGLALIAVGVSYFRDYAALRALAIVAGGIAVITNSVLPGGPMLLAAAGAAGGTALAIFGIMYFLQTAAFHATKERLRILVAEPDNSISGRHRPPID